MILRRMAEHMRAQTWTLLALEAVRESLWPSSPTQKIADGMDMGWSPLGCSPRPHVALVSRPYNRHANPRIPEEGSLSIVSIRQGLQESDHGSTCLLPCRMVSRMIPHVTP
jgi:hypothetical protein